jgi:hypothetical protein
MEDARASRTGQTGGDARYGLTPTESQITGVASKPHPYRVRGCKLELTRISQQYTKLKRHRHLSQYPSFQIHPNLTSTVSRWEGHNINGKLEPIIYWSDNSSLSSTTPLCDRAFSQDASRRPSIHESRFHTRSIQWRRELRRCMNELDRIGEGRLNHVCEGWARQWHGFNMGLGWLRSELLDFQRCSHEVFNNLEYFAVVLPSRSRFQFPAPSARLTVAPPVFCSSTLVDIIVATSASWWSRRTSEVG